MPHPFGRLTFLAALLLVSACKPAPATPVVADAALAIDSLYHSFRAAYKDLDADRVVNLYQTDAVYGTPGAHGYTLGHAPLQTSFGSFFDAIRADSSWLELRFRFVSRFRSPALASDAGYYWLRSRRGEGGGTPSVGKFVTVIIPDSSGQWRFAVDSYSEATVAAFDSAPPFEP